MDRAEWGPPTAGIAAIAVAGIIMAIGAMSVAADAARSATGRRQRRPVEISDMA